MQVGAEGERAGVLRTDHGENLGLYSHRVRSHGPVLSRGEAGSDFRVHRIPLPAAKEWTAWHRGRSREPHEDTTAAILWVACEGAWDRVGAVWVGRSGQLG